MAFCEAEGLEYVLAHVTHLRTGNPARVFAVLAKAEHLPKGSNPRFVVTSLAAALPETKTPYS